MIICGVDEAGRGPVIGPMVMVGCNIEQKDEKLLKELGVADSKKLSPAKREELFDKIIALVKYEVEILTPQIIDAALNDPYLNLNKLEALATARLLNKLKPQKAFIDLPTKDASTYIAEINKSADVDVDIVAEHKADDNYAICSAASILAKVIRDKEIQKIKDEFGIDIGSGYPSDQKTRDFLKNNYKKYDFFRKTWQTYKDVADAKKQKKLGEF